jgi:glutathione S-transferase
MPAMAEPAPVLYSFRRCPYAMRARMALTVSGAVYEHREVVLRDKPEAMIEASPKGTVPVLVLQGGEVVDESLAIMIWALNANDPENWLAWPSECEALIQANDGPFKHDLDRYKYANRYDGADPLAHRASGLAHLKDLARRLEMFGQLCGPQISLADIAIFPFVRQFANTDRAWFDETAPESMQTWLAGHQNSDLFTQIMGKFPPWHPDQQSFDLPL